MKYARLDENNIVIDIVNADSAEWLQENVGGRWIQSFDDGTRLRQACKGGLYDEDNDIFLRPQPFPSWVLNDDFEWIAPIPEPSKSWKHWWDEETSSWIVIPSAPPSDGKVYVWDQQAAAWVTR